MRTKKQNFLTSSLLMVCLCILSACTQGNATKKDYADYVNPIIGSGGHGHVFVGASVPFGAMQLGPQNINKGWDWCSGYHYSDSVVIGFSHNHLSGTGCGDLGDIIFMPYSGALRTSQDQGANPETSASSKYRHENETASPGYYRILLDNGVDVELTATERVGLHHYQYNGEGEARLLIDLDNSNGSQVFEGYIHKIDETTVEGYHFVHGWAPTHKIFFYAKFNQPIKDFTTFIVDTEEGKDELHAERVKGVATFDEGVKDVLVKVATSSVSMENAKMNMEAELPEWDFAATHQQAVDKWNEALSVIDIEGTEKQKEIFYTALYHSFIAPTLYCDVNGEFLGIDGQIHTDSTKQNYTTFSLWDTYRTLHPMFTIIKPDMVPGMMNSMLSIYDQNGLLPIWPLLSGETYCMPGYSSVPVIADAYLKGFTGFDAERSLNAMVATATSDRMNGVAQFKKFGYIPADLVGEATSINLEYAADDWGLALMAKKMGKMDIYETFIKRGKSYQLFWDESIRKVHPKMSDGSWYEPYSPFLANHRDHGNIGDFTEGNGWEYTFMVPQHPDGLIALHGGDDAFITNLDSLFIAEGDLGEGAPPDVSGMVGQYAHGNEPNHHIPYLYVYAGAQWKTAELVRRLQEQFYTDDENGYCGNEDCGQMSAWHIMSALGLYQVNPSNGIYVFGSPLFKKATVKLPEGKTFVIEAPENSEKNVYIQSATLNGEDYQKSFITYDDIMKGGVLTFKMSSEANKSFGQAQENRPVSAE